jgi:hypothetical protein
MLPFPGFKRMDELSDADRQDGKRHIALIGIGCLVIVQWCKPMGAWITPKSCKINQSQAWDISEQFAAGDNITGMNKPMLAKFVACGSCRCPWSDIDAREQIRQMFDEVREMWQRIDRAYDSLIGDEELQRHHRKARRQQQRQQQQEQEQINDH